MDDEAARASSPHLSVTTNTYASLHRNTQPPAIPFLNLPPEIRNEIYKWLFPRGPSAAQLLAKHKGGFIQMSDRFTLLGTCRQIYEEASSLLRGQQRFAINQPKTLFDVMDENYEEIEALIIGHVIPGFGVDFYYDLDHDTVTSSGTSMLHTSLDFRDRVAYYANIDTTVTMSVTMSVTGELRRLSQWVQSDRARNTSLYTHGQEQSTYIVLRCPRTNGDNITDFRIDAVELFWATRELYRVTYVRTVMVDENGTQKECSRDLGRILASLLLFMHTLSKRTPGGKCPKIWLRGDLEVDSAELQHEDGTIETIPNRDADRSWEQVLRCLYAGGIIRHYCNIDDLQPHDNGSSKTRDIDGDKPAIRERETLLGVAKTLAGCVEDFPVSVVFTEIPQRAACL